MTTIRCVLRVGLSSRVFFAAFKQTANGVQPFSVRPAASIFAECARRWGRRNGYIWREQGAQLFWAKVAFASRQRRVTMLFPCPAQVLYEKDAHVATPPTTHTAPCWFCCLIRHFCLISKKFHFFLSCPFCIFCRFLCRNKNNPAEMKIPRSAALSTMDGVSHCARKMFCALWRL